MRSPPSRGATCLPRYLTSFVGRQEEIAEITILLARDDVRLLTLTGPGGAGKTRLAVETVARLDASACDGIWFVPLVAVRDPALVLPAIAQTLGLHQVAGRPVVDTITHFLHDRRALLLIDNFELVREAAPGLGHVLTACPGTTMLVTSRVALRISGEHLMTIKPLDTPGSTDIPLDELRGIASVQLFLQRANSSGRKMALTEDTARDLAGICRRLDGLPLALELAAARTGLLSPAALLELLRQGSGLLSDGPPDAHERHRSMHDAIAWSYDLLPEQEQAVFRRLSVFSGGFTLEAAEAVVDLPVDMLATISSLASKSLVVPVQGDSLEPRFTMLETIREFGGERLTREGESRPVRDRHAAYFLQEAVDCEYAWLMPFEAGAILLSRIQLDHLNYRDALDWLDRSGHDTEALQLAGSLAPLWILCGYASEGRALLTRLLARQAHADSPVYINAIATLSWLGNQQGTMEEAFRLAHEGLMLLRSRDHPFLVVRCLVLAGVAAAELEKFDLATHMLEEAMARTFALDGPDWWQNWANIALVHLGYTALMQGRIDDAEARFQDAIARQTVHGYEPGTSYIYGYMLLTGLGRVAGARGDPTRALHLFQQSLGFTRRFSRWNIGIVNFSIRVISLIAGTLAALGKIDDAARLFGASEGLGERYSYHFAEAASLGSAYGIPPRGSKDRAPVASPYMPHTAPDARANGLARNRVSEDRIQHAWEIGRTLSLPAAIGEALAAAAAMPTLPDCDPSTVLTRREAEVLRLVAEGCSNRTIANTLSLSERTVEHHVTHILAKLDLDSRTAAATFAVRQGLL